MASAPIQKVKGKRPGAPDGIGKGPKLAKPKSKKGK